MIEQPKFNHPIAVYLKYENCIIRVKCFIYNITNVDDIDWEEASWSKFYYYNQHTCPSNWLAEDSGMIDVTYWNTDPHGLFEVYAITEWTEEWEDTLSREELQGAAKVFNQRVNNYCDRRGWNREFDIEDDLDD